MSYQPPAPSPGNDANASLFRHAVDLARAVGLAMQGKINAVTTLTLTANAASTAFSDPRLTVNSHVALQPLTANAAAALATTYATTANQNNGTWTFTHANTATTDRTFRVLIVG